jgi:arylsulfatase
MIYGNENMPKKYEKRNVIISMNVLLIMTDQQRYDTLGCYGNEVIETANLDWLASMGTVFTNAYTPSPSCIPARSSLLSGMDPWNTGVIGMGRAEENMGVGFKHTLPGELAKAGYHTQGVGKMHFFPQRALNGFHNTIMDEHAIRKDPGFVSDYEQWYDHHKVGDHDMVAHGLDWNTWMARPFHTDENLHPTNWTINESIRFLKERDPSKPFFLKTSFTRPHSPYDAPQFYYDLYQQKQIPEPHIGDWATINDRPEDAASPRAWRGKRKREETIRARAAYYACIHHIDHQIGRLLMYLLDTGELNNTLILFTSDHGDMLGDHNLWRKTHAYEGSAKIPFIVVLPRSLRGNHRKRVSKPVVIQDIMPTILEAVGCKIPKTVDGRSVLGLIRGENEQWREYVHGEHTTCYHEDQEMQFVTDGKYKFIWYPRLGTEQLFDLQKDPGECEDLSANPEYQAELLSWRKRLVKELEPRNLGLTEGEGLVCQNGKPPLVSPNYMDRYNSSAHKWKLVNQLN